MEFKEIEVETPKLLPTDSEENAMNDLVIEEVVPALCPFTTNFEDAILEIKEPIRALAESILHMGVGGGKDEVLIPVAATIRNFLEQLDYVLRHAYVGDEPVMFSDIRHPFTIKAAKAKVDEANEEGGVQ
jgi:hypothetical protein